MGGEGGNIWLKASFCNIGGCVEVAFTKSSFCLQSGCVEVAREEGAVLVRDSKNLDSPVLQFDREEWAAFVAGVKAGEFDLK